MKKILTGLVVVSLLFCGCAAIKQAIADKQLSDTTPLSAGETSPQVRGENIGQAVGGLAGAGVNVVAPGAGGIASTAVAYAVGGIAAWIFGWRRGRKLRLGQPLSTTPISGAFGQSIGLEAIIQHLADVVTGLTEVGPQGSVIKRGWKVALLTGLGLAVQPYIQPLSDYLTQNPPAALAAPMHGTILALSVAGLAAAEKWLSKVLPVIPPPTPLAA